jgi:hypothetical protein
MVARDQEETSVLRAPIGGLPHQPAAVAIVVLYYLCCIIVVRHSRKGKVDRTEAGASTK